MSSCFSRKLLQYAWVIALCGCSDQAKFGGSGSGTKEQVRASAESMPDPTPTPEPSKPEVLLEAEESYDSASLKQAGKLDIIWTIDNSGSMGEEAAQVRLNFQKFISSLGSSTDLRLNLISAVAPQVGAVTDTSVRLDAAAIAAGHSQLDVSIGSTNLLAISAAAICPLASTDATAPVAPATTLKVCDQQVNLAETGGIEAIAQVAKAREGISKNMRGEAKKIFVFVTDDNARGVLDAQFLKILQAQKGFESATVFAFRGDVSKTGCSIARKGAVYEELATKTGGAVFDICLPDWSESFSKLKDQAVRIANSNIALTQEGITEITEVKVGSKVLEKTSYRWSGKTLAIEPKALQGTEGKIIVRYKYRKS